VLDNAVLALETTGEGTGIFAGGVFGTLNGEGNNRGLLKINNDGDRVGGFAARPNALVTSLVRLDNTLYLGGNFTDISNTPVENLAAIDTISGAVDSSLNLDFNGTISTETVAGVQGVDDIDITSDGQLMVILGNFETIDGISRIRFAVIELEGQAKVSAWNTDVFDLRCDTIRFPQYLRGIDIAPDDSYFITGSSGARSDLNPACDTIIRFEFGDLTNTNVQPTWVNFTGGDSVFEVVSTDHAIYVGGHFRWLNNSTSIDPDSAGPGSAERLGLAALDPLNGLPLLDWRSDRNPRGAGTFALIAEPEGLYIGDDTDFLNGTEHRKLKFLPITSDTIARPDKPSLPTTILSNNGDALEGASFDGTNLGAPQTLLFSEGANTRAAMFIGGQLFHADVNGTMWMSQLTDGEFDPRAEVDLFGLTNTEWEISQLGGMFFDYEQGRVYYTRQGDSRLLARAFTPDGPYFGNQEFVAEQQSDILWGDISGMDVIDGSLYFTRFNDSSLFRAAIDGANVTSGTTVEISGPAIDGRIWNNSVLAFLSEGTLVGEADREAQFEFRSSGSQAVGRFRTFEYSVEPGEPVVVRLAWDNPDARLNLFVRDANGVLVASDSTAAASPKWVTAPSGEGGIYTVSVLIAEGSSPYTIQVNPEDEPPESLADFEFRSAGDSVNDRFQSFNVDVVTGELVDVLVTWDDPAAEVSVFLRDENGIQVDRNTDGNGSATVSAVAQTSGRWSVAVSIRTAAGTVNYDILVNTDLVNAN